MGESRAAADYGRAKTPDELHFAAGEHLALHAGAVSAALHLPRRGSLVLALMERAAFSRWERYWRIHNDAFCASALLDLCTVRSVFREQERWPEFSGVLDEVMIMACAHLVRLLRMTLPEKEALHERATDHLVAFQNDDSRTSRQQIDVIMSIDGFDKSRVDRAAFIKAAIRKPSWLDPWALIRHHDRLARTAG
jgi:hypothetical protein